MSIKVMSQVWESYPGSGSELLAMLALADWSDDNGRCYPAVSTIARRMRFSRSQAQRVVHQLIDDGFLVVTANSLGGAPTQTRHYRIVLSRLTGRADATPTGSVHATGSTDATGSTHAQEGSHGCAGRGSAHATRTVIEPSITVNKVSSRKKTEITIKQFIEACKANSEQTLPEKSPIYIYAEKVGITDEMISVCWQEFKNAYLDSDKAYADWRKTFGNCVRGNWYKLWFMKEGEQAAWTSVGEQARRAAA